MRQNGRGKISAAGKTSFPGEISVAGKISAAIFVTLANGQSLKLSPSHDDGGGDSVSIDKGTGRSPGSDSI